MARFLLVFIVGWFALATASFGANFMLVSDKVKPAPRGMVVLCTEEPTSIVCATKRPATISLEAHAAKLLAINEHVNSSLRVTNDARGTDVWHLDARQGDCEEFVLAKLAALVAIGIPRGALSIASVQVDDSFHAILMVATDQGDFVLDNLNPDLTRWDLLKDYRFLARESADNPLQWTLVF